MNYVAGDETQRKRPIASSNGQNEGVAFGTKQDASLL